MPSESTTKQCGKCGAVRSIDAFYRDRSKPDGHATICIPCHKTSAHDRYATNPEPTRERSRQWYEQNRDRALDRQRDYNERNSEQVQRSRRDRWERQSDELKLRKRQSYAENPIPAQDRARNYREQNPEKVRAAHQRYYAQHRTTIIGRVKNWIIANRARANEHRKGWKIRNPAKVLAHTHRRRAQLNAGGTYTEAEWRALCAWFGDKCLCCGAAGITIDHVIPISKGGSNTIENLQPLCGTCNYRKHDRAIDYRDPDTLAAFLDALEGR